MLMDFNFSFKYVCGHASHPCHHNEYFNYYSHKQDDLCKRPRDISPVQIASKLLPFEFLKEHLSTCNTLQQLTDYQNCHIILKDISASVAGNVLSMCHTISQPRFSQIHNIGNNANIGIRGFTTGKQKNPVTKCYP